MGGPASFFPFGVGVDCVFAKSRDEASSGDVPTRGVIEMLIGSWEPGGLGWVFVPEGGLEVSISTGSVLFSIDLADCFLVTRLVVVG